MKINILGIYTAPRFIENAKDDTGLGPDELHGKDEDEDLHPVVAPVHEVPVEEILWRESTKQNWIRLRVMVTWDVRVKMIP